MKDTIKDESTYVVHVLCSRIGDSGAFELKCALYKDMPDRMECGIPCSKWEDYLVLETVLNYYTLAPMAGEADMLAYLVERGFDADAVKHAVGRDSGDCTRLVHGRHDVRSYRMPVDPSKFVEWASRARKCGNLELADVDNGDRYIPQSWMEEAKGLHGSEISWVARTGAGSFEVFKAEDIAGAKAVTMVVSTVADRIDLIEIELRDGSVRAFKPYSVAYNDICYGDYGMCSCRLL
ncbi:MAG: hypothetical protein MJZ17_04845 [Bacteroidales bacterium]|nr:hypothetical protein [Bacteroidales bacterium]